MTSDIRTTNILTPGILTPELLKLRIASQFAPWKQRGELERLCASLEAGHDWPAQPHDGRLTSQLVGKRLGPLFEAGTAAGHPADIVLAVFERRHRMRATWYEMLGALLYPTLLLFASLAIASVVGMLLMSYADNRWSGNEQYHRVTHDFFDASLGALIMLAWTLVLGLTVYFGASSNALLKMIGSLPLVGRPYRWMALSDLLMRLAIFATYRPELARALRLTADSYGTQALAAIAKHAAEAIERGETLQHALHQTILSDQQAGMALTLIESESAQFVDSAQRASELLEDMTQQLCERVKMIYPTFILLLVASIVWGAWSSYIEVFRLMTSAFI